VANRQEHRELARELLLACAEAQDSHAEPGRPTGYYVRREDLEALFRPREDDVIPQAPGSYLVLPKLTSGNPARWPMLGVYFLNPSTPSAFKAPPLELASFEVVLMAEAAVPVAFRFEPPSSFWHDGTPAGEHGYYHMQFVSVLRANAQSGTVGDIVLLPDHSPAVPIRACDFGSLILALVVALYGRTVVEDGNFQSLNLDVRAGTTHRLRKAYKELGYWKWEPTNAAAPAHT
jgi:hypothetical protein